MNRLKHLIAVIAGLAIHLPCSAQTFTNELILQKLASLDKKQAPAVQLQLLYDWKNQAETLHLPQDSVYAKLLHRIGALEFLANKNYNVAIGATLKAMQINTSGKTGASGVSAVIDLYNLALYYEKLNLFKKSLIYYEQAIRQAQNTSDIDNALVDSRLARAYIFFRMGDYEKAVEESDLGISTTLKNNDSLYYLSFLNQRAQALFFQDKLQSASADVQIVIPLAKVLHQSFELASAFKTQAFIHVKKKEYPMAVTAFRNCLTERSKSKAFWQLSGDYNDFGNFFSDSLRSYGRAATCYLTAIRYAKKEDDSIRMARASLNLGRNYLAQREYTSSIYYHLQAMHYLKISKGADLIGNPAAAELSTIGNKELIQFLFNSKTELFLRLYKQTREKKWLTACLQTALLNDSLIVEIRHELLGQQSKLFWRNITRDFFSNAIEACYLANDHKLAFYFMEKSRSVLLQDKLSELGASGLLPPDETAKQEKLQIRIIELQEKISTSPDTSVSYKELRIKLIETKEDLERHIRSLEARYPSYYQYKYADKVISLSSLQTFLSEKRQRFIDYFIEDTLSFALCITPVTSTFIRIENKNMDTLLIHFIKTCSDEEVLNKGFPAFLVSANNIYNLLLKPFQLPEGRVIVCVDNHLIPFEALSRNSGKADFLLNTYSFSYVYSARSLFNQYEHGVGKGDFLGLAPVNFAAYTGLPDLMQSEDALTNCSAYYNRTKLLIHTDATRRNFLQQVSHYEITTIFTHARADSSDDEPLLFMNDSVIHLSELQILNKPATKLIVLSACETNVGKNLNGEGIFSLARGFSAAGIPSVVATQWKADEQAIYSISEKFNEQLSGGMNKDEALQKAKLFYITQKGNVLPCYWADMILIGNSDPVRFSSGGNLQWQLVAALLAVIVIAAIVYRYYIRKSPRL